MGLTTERAQAFSQWLTKELAGRGWTQAQVARELGTTASVVNQWTRQGRISPEMAGSLAEVLAIDPIELFVLLGWLPEDAYIQPNIDPLLARELSRLTRRQQRALVPLLDSVLVLHEELAEYDSSAPLPEPA